MSMQGLSPRLVQSDYTEIIADETRAMLHQIANDPNQLLKALRRYV